MEIKELHQKLSDCLNTVRLGAAGRLLYYDEDINTFVLCVHTTDPEKTHKATQLAWDSIPDSLRAELKDIGFAGRQI